MVIASIVIPAHNEALVIGRCLDALDVNGHPDTFDVVVACNGCSDDTARIAERYEGVRIVETATASKAVALNLGDTATDVFPRIYLDADIELSYNAALAVVDALHDPRPLAAAPTPEFDLSGRPWMVQAFYRAWQRSPYLTKNMVGSGVYAVNESGRRKFTEFPAVFNDDLFVRSSFSADERVSVSGATFKVRPPRTLRDLINVRRRIYFGNAEMNSSNLTDVRSNDNSGGSAKQILRQSHSAHDLADAVIYLSICAVAKWLARRDAGKRSVEWRRDASGRSSD
jgi:glycosyltransferase involved in cell wall biosynthesis